MVNETTLIVLQHGLWGTASHMEFIEQQIVENLDSKTIVVLNVECNEDKYTYDGVDICGNRLADNIQDHVKYLADEENKKVTKLILIGYSLGGLMARYAVGILGKNGFFDSIEPFLFVTFATPHLGVRRETKSKFAKVYNFVTGHMLSRTGEQLQLLDKFENTNRPLLSIMADPKRPFHQYLAKFKTRRIYANVTNDRTVPYWTAAIEPYNYFEKMKNVELSLDTEYPSVVTAFDVRQHDDKNKQEREKERRNQTAVAIKFAILVFSPILFPILGTLAFTYIGTQGLVSRYRVSRILASSPLLLANVEGSTSANDEKETVEDHPSHDENTRIKRSNSGGSTTSDDDNTLLHHHHHHHHHKEDPVLMDTLDAMDTIPNETNIDRSPQTTQHTKTKDRRSLYNIEPSKTIRQTYSAMQLINEQFEIERNMQQLEWERVMVYIDTFNAHASIVCRAKRFTNTGGKAAIRHFVDSLLLE
ncbi:putative serine esterase-domain-containing protein [Phascolomyces articulosus]|uniref:Serine esterase-domain-containing protein n=1 Tax=Phascolomyces articulosus TaxID=60185 RepID=A0AAD5JV46_9FUNG|nr:putative serine esterase-domain-containing protein [Phascolomyces articulosus]